MRKLTITGKVLVIKSEVVPKLLYLGYVFPMPQVFRIKPEEIYCLQQSTASKHYDVTFCTGECAEEVRRRFHGEENEELKKYTVTPLYRNDYRILTIHMYNPWVSEETIKYFLGRYVTVLPGVRKIKDGLGLWTGKRQFRVKLNVDTSTEDGYCHPPAVFSIGADRGFLVYAGQPQACRKCGSTGHNADRCEQMRCRSCGKIGHITKDCKEPRKCHLCDSETHMARDCTRPRSYSEAAGNEHYRKSDAEADIGKRTQEASTAAEDHLNEERAGSKEGGVEQRNKEEGTLRESDAEREKQAEDGQVWAVVAKPRRKSAKRRRKVSSGASPEETKTENKEDREERIEQVENTEGHVLRGTQTECMHTPLSDFTSDGDTGEEAESEEKSEDSFIKNLLAQVNMKS
uniref:CCHC-type domain-containing protein n=1 Tax=Maylandia zebra TaxID=106582 RepID=A0A3P9DFL4_9CICH